MTDNNDSQASADPTNPRPVLAIAERHLPLAVPSGANESISGSPSSGEFGSQATSSRSYGHIDAFRNMTDFDCDPGTGLTTARPVKAETFCECLRVGKEKDCKCGEDDSYFDWTWDEDSKSSATVLRDDKREVIFHTDYSCGTAAVRGSKPMRDDQYFWEVKMTTPVYGTDMMVGVGSSHMDLDKYKHNFCSMIGRDGDSWGLSYSGNLHHKGRKRRYASKFGQGSIIGIHLDMWHGTLSYYKNRKPLGVAFRGLQGKVLYPLVSSTAARSGMKVVTSRSFHTSLQFMCCQILRRLIPKHLNVLDALVMPPGLCAFLENNMGWLLQPSFTDSTSVTTGQKRSREEMESDSREVTPQKVKRVRVEGSDL